MQLKYDLQQPESFAGMLVDNRTNEIVTASAAEDLSFGRPVYVSSWSGVKPVVSQVDTAATALTLFGFIVYEPRMRGNWPVSYSGDDNDAAGTIIKKDMEVAVIRKGVLWTDYTDVNVVAGQVGLVIAAGGATKVGKLKSAAATGAKGALGLGTAGDVTYYGLQFLDTANAGKLAKLQVNLPCIAVKQS